MKNEKKINKWKEKIRTEYINKLPLEKHEVVDYKTFGRSSDEDKMKIEFIYLRAHIKTAETLTAAVKRIKGLETPYIEFQYLGEELIKEFKKGYYNPVLYIPE